MALNNVGRVAKLTRERVAAAAMELGFVPNPAAKLLGSSGALGKTSRYIGTVAMILGLELYEKHRARHSATECLLAFEQRIGELGYTVDHLVFSHDMQMPGTIDRILRARGIRGVFVVAGNMPVDRFPIDWNKLSAVVSSPDEHSPRLHCGVTNHFEDAYLATRKVLDYGYTNPVLLSNRMTPHARDHYGLDQFIGGYEAALYRVGHHKMRPPIEIKDSDFSKALAKILRIGADAVISDWPNTTLPMMQSAGYRIPDQFGAAFLSIFPKAEPRAAGIYQDAIGRDRLLADLLASMLARGETGIPERPTLIQVPGTWVDGPTLPRRS